MTESRNASRPARREPLWRHLAGAQLRAWRHARRETLDEVARRAGVSPQYLSEIERGVKEPSSEMIAAVATALDASLLDLARAVTLALAPVPLRPGSASTPSRPASTRADTVLLAA